MGAGGINPDGEREMRALNTSSADWRSGGGDADLFAAAFPDQEHARLVLRHDGRRSAAGRRVAADGCEVGFCPPHDDLGGRL